MEIASSEKQSCLVFFFSLGQVITFNFVHFDLGPQSANPCDAGVDRLVITEMTSHGLVRFCASSPMRTYVSHSNEVALQFITNDNVDAQGFRVFYTGGNDKTYFRGCYTGLKKSKYVFPGV